jgi:hypothetical protein
MQQQIAKNTACRKVTKEKFKGLDWFGQNVTFTYKGDD